MSDTTESSDRVNQAVDSFVRSHDTGSFDRNLQIIQMARAVSNIPWGEARTMEEVFRLGVGTCTGKHALLRACFERIGVSCEDVVCTFRWEEQGFSFPSNLQSILDEGSWEHGHNFLRVNGSYDLDVTWDKALSPSGFKVLPEDWEPGRSFIGINNVVRRFDGVRVNECKEKILAEMDDVARERRERFLKELCAWIHSLRN